MREARPQDGATSSAIDIARQLPTRLHYPMATPEDLERPISEVEALGRRMVLDTLTSVNRRQ